MSEAKRPPANILTIDVEDYFHVSVFDGVVPRRDWGRLESRVVANTDRLLGILAAGGTYVPLDPAYPVMRQRFMLEDSGARVLLTESALPAEIGDDRDRFADARPRHHRR